MNRRWAILVAASLVAFASLVITWQFRHYDGDQDQYSSLAQAFLRGKQLAAISDIWKRDGYITIASGDCRHLDLILPSDARIFMTDMTGPTNYNKIGNYFWMTYYLFPREIGTSLDHITRQTKDGFVGTTSESSQEIRSNGFDIRMDSASGRPTFKVLRILSIGKPVNPDWFDSKSDLVIAFLLPLLTALAGMWLLRVMFPMLKEQMPMLEQLASSLGLGMVAVAALTLGVKLCGFHGQRLILIVTTIGAIAEIWRDLKVLLAKITDSSRKLIRSPVTAVFLAIGLLVFLILFRIAGLEGLTDGDAMRWMLKTKIIHLYTGKELVQWFSNPALAHAHLDYPTLLPSLHAATYDSIGHVDEFVTKFWPTWMLFFLIAALVSLNRAGTRWFHAPSFALLGLLLLPVIQSYVQMEGSTMPMIFFTVMGSVQCAIGLIGKNRARLGLGLTLLFGGAMTHLEGFIFLALASGWIFLLPSARPSLKPSPCFWWMLAFCFLAALPYICLRVQIPSLEYESGWAGYAQHNPGSTLSSWPGIFMILLARWFVNPNLANWSGDAGEFHWIGKWDGFSSLYNQLTLGLPWLCLFMTVALWFAVPARRQVIIWMLAILTGTLAVFSMVFASFTSIESLDVAIAYTDYATTTRYLLPLLMAWFATMMTMLFADLHLSVAVPDTSAAGPRVLTSAGSTIGVKTGLKEGKK